MLNTILYKFMIKIFISILCFLFLNSCSNLSKVKDFFDPSCQRDRYVRDTYSTYKYTNFKIKPNKETPTGVRVDTSGRDIDLDQIDRIIKQFEQCSNTKVDRCGLIIKISEHTHVDKSTGIEFFDCTISGKIERCTGINESPNVIITTPNLRSLSHELNHRVLFLDCVNFPNMKFTCE